MTTGFSALLLAERKGFEPMWDCSQTDFESYTLFGSLKNLIEDNRLCYTPKNARKSRLSDTRHIENPHKLYVCKHSAFATISNNILTHDIRKHNRNRLFSAYITIKNLHRLVPTVSRHNTHNRMTSLFQKS